MTFQRNPEDDLLEIVAGVHEVVFDLNTLAQLDTPEERTNFQQLVHLLQERDFKIVLISRQIESYTEWANLHVKVLYWDGDDLEHLCQNESLFGEHVFWVTEALPLQRHLAERNLLFAYGSDPEEDLSGLRYQNLRDLLVLFNPSQHTAMHIAESILEVKRRSPKTPLLVGIGGPDECGHAFFVGALVEELEKYEFLVAGMDLTELLSTEFLQRKNSHNSYWRSEAIQQWALEECLQPFAAGHQVVIESPPAFIENYETSIYPLFLSPEMIVLVWGTTVFVPEIQDLLGQRILLELSPKVATARLFGIDDRENFDTSFIEKYQETEGRLYQEYLHAYDVRPQADWLVDFDNFYAGRLKHPQGAIVV